MKKFVLFATIVAFCGSVVFGEDIADILKTKKVLRFNKDGNFRILVLGDIQSSASPLQENNQENIKKLVDKEKPNLVLFAGDNSIRMNTEERLRTYINSMVGYIEEKQIPWAHVYGNHDHEGALSKEAQEEIFESFEWCITERGPKDIAGVGNCVLPVFASNSNKPVFNVWAIDSGTYLSKDEQMQVAPKKSPYRGAGSTNYDYIRPNQIAWYVETSKKLEKYAGKKIPGLMVFHIPLQESFFAWENREGLEFTGEKREGVCASVINSGLFATILERGDVKAIVNGHDHINDYMVKYMGVILSFCSTPSTGSYHNKDMLGGRVFVINEKSPDEITTYMSYLNREQVNIKDVKPIAADNVIDFDEVQPKALIAGYDGANSEFVGKTVKATIANNKGINGSKALSIVQSEFNNSAYLNNFELHIPFAKDAVGTLGDAKFLKVYMDFSGRKMQD